MVDFTHIDSDRFSQALTRKKKTAFPASVGDAENRFSTINERSVHLALKYYIEPDASCHEVPIGRYVADIFTGEEVVEIQTSGYYRLEDKLLHLTELYPVTLVCPLFTERYLVRYNPETGEIYSRRRGKTKNTLYEALGHLLRLIPLFKEGRIALWFPYLRVTELRPGDPMRPHYRPAKVDTLPEALCGGLYLTSPGELVALLPDSLGSGFTCKEAAAIMKLRPSEMNGLLRFMTECGLLSRRKEGRSYLYTREESSF